MVCFFSYKQNLKKSFLFNHNPDSELQLSVTFGNQTYTPKNHSSFNVNDFDRPYAGWLFGALELGSLKQNRALFLNFESGITGKESLSGKLQTIFHDLLKIDNPTWVEEIAYTWLFNISVRYYMQLELNKRNALLFNIYPTIGTKDVFLKVI